MFLYSIRFSCSKPLTPLNTSNECSHIIYLLAIEWSEQDTLRGNTIENRGYLFVYVDVRMSFSTLTLVYFCVSSVFDPVPNCTEQNPLVYRSLPYHPKN